MMKGKLKKKRRLPTKTPKLKGRDNEEDYDEFFE